MLTTSRCTFRHCGLANIQEQIEEDVTWNDGEKADPTIVHLQRLEMAANGTTLLPLCAVSIVGSC